MKKLSLLFLFLFFTLGSFSSNLGGHMDSNENSLITSISDSEENQTTQKFLCRPWTVVLETEVNGVKYLEHYEFHDAQWAYTYASLHNGVSHVSYNPCGGGSQSI